MFTSAFSGNMQNGSNNTYANIDSLLMNMMEQ